MKRTWMILVLPALLLAGCAGQPASSAASSDQACDSAEEAYGCVPEEGSAASANPSANDYGFEPMTFQEAINLFKNGGNGLLYFGFPDCPWCKEVVPLLQAEAKKQGVPVHYIRTRDDDRQLLYTEKQREEIAPYLKEFVTRGDDGKLKLYVPLVVTVRNGEMVDGHQSTVDGHNAKERPMTTQEKEQVEEIMAKLVNEAKAS